MNHDMPIVAADHTTAALANVGELPFRFDTFINHADDGATPAMSLELNYE